MHLWKEDLAFFEEMFSSTASVMMPKILRYKHFIAADQYKIHHSQFSMLNYCILRSIEGFWCMSEYFTPIFYAKNFLFS